jgi:hypothetical protein
MAIAGCGGESTDRPSPSPTSETAANPSSDSAEPEPAAFTPERTFDGEVEVSDGSTWDLRIEVGALAAAGEAEAAPAEFAELATACEVDSQRDALVPIRLSATSTNATGYDQDISTGVVFSDLPGGIDRGDVLFEIASSFDDGPQCDSGTSTARLEERVEFSGVAPDEERTHEMLLVIHDYYSPAAPEGRAGEIADARVSTPVVVNAHLTCFGGSGGADGSFMLNGTPIEAEERDVPEC